MFFCVTLHEVGHALAARHFEIETRSIVLFPFGGVTNIRNLPQMGREEFFIALAGPLVNLGLVVLTGAALLLGWGGELFARWLSRPDSIWRWLVNAPFEGELALGLVVYLLLTNLLLALFNLIPAFPMDGGRMLRAVLSTRLPFQNSTRIAARTGQFLSVVTMVLMVSPHFNMQSPSSVLIAVLVFLGATYEDRLVQRRWRLHQMRVGEVEFCRQLRPVLPEQQLKDVVSQALKNPQLDLLVINGRGMVGLLRRDDLLKAMNLNRLEMLVSEVMRTDVPPVSLDDSLQAVRTTMAQTHYTTLPVLDKGRLLGLITLNDLELPPNQPNFDKTGQSA
jgi:Zn-dependent protease